MKVKDKLRTLQIKLSPTRLLLPIFHPKLQSLKIKLRPPERIAACGSRVPAVGLGRWWIRHHFTKYPLVLTKMLRVTGKYLTINGTTRQAPMILMENLTSRWRLCFQLLQSSFLWLMIATTNLSSTEFRVHCPQMSTNSISRSFFRILETYGSNILNPIPLVE